MVSVQAMVVMLTFAVLLVASVMVGVIGFGLAKWQGTLTSTAVSRGFAACGAALTLGLVALGVIITALK
jgi:hypothetical protein